MLGDGVFKNLSMRAIVDGVIHDGSDTADFIEGELKELSNLHFKNTPASSTTAPETPETQIAVELASENKSTVLAKTTAEQEAEPSK